MVSDAQTETFLSPLLNRIDRMVAGARITLRLDPEPPSLIDPGKQHPVVTARQDGFYFKMDFPYPDGTGQQVKEEIQEFLSTLTPHPIHEGFFAREENGVCIRFQVSNIIRWNEKRIWILDGKIMEGCYEDLKGISVRAWGLEQ